MLAGLLPNDVPITCLYCVIWARNSVLFRSQGVSLNRYAMTGYGSLELIHLWHSTKWLRLQVGSCGIYGRQNDNGTGFLWVFCFPLPILIPPIAPYSLSFHHWPYIVSILTALLNNKQTKKLHKMDISLTNCSHNQSPCYWIYLHYRTIINFLGSHTSTANPMLSLLVTGYIFTTEP
jgi:hypothetical protein